MILEPDQDGINLIKSFEGLRLKAYRDQVGVLTIGYGNTYYADGKPVRDGDIISKEYAESLFKIIVDRFYNGLKPLIKSNLNQNQSNAILSLAYNIGLGRFKKSHILELINENPNNTLIKSEFLKWDKAGEKINDGLLRRRIKESKLYFYDNGR